MACLFLTDIRLMLTIILISGFFFTFVDNFSIRQIQTFAMILSTYPLYSKTKKNTYEGDLTFRQVELTACVFYLPFSHSSFLYINVDKYIFLLKVNICTIKYGEKKN